MGSIDPSAVARWAFAALRNHPVTLIGLAALPVIVQAPLLALTDGSAAVDEEVMLNIDPTLGLVLAVGALVVTVLAQAALLRGALKTTVGDAPDFGDMANFERLGRWIFSGLLAALVVLVGLVLLVLPGIVAGFFFYFINFEALDNDGPVTAVLRTSVDLVKNNVGAVLLLVLIVFGAALGVGIVVQLAAFLHPFAGIVAQLLSSVPAAYAMLLGAAAYRQAQGVSLAPQK